jgi:hypothetical protein
MPKRILKMFYLIGLVLVTIVVFGGCGKIVYVPVPVPAIPNTTTITTGPPNQIFNAQTWDVFPSNGVYVQAGKTLTLSWSADGGLVGYIFTTNQYNSWINSLRTEATFEGHDSGSTGSMTVTIQNSDTYCAVLLNNAISILGENSVKVYQATLTEH